MAFGGGYKDMENSCHGSGRQLASINSESQIDQVMDCASSGDTIPKQCLINETDIQSPLSQSW